MKLGHDVRIDPDARFTRGHDIEIADHVAIDRGVHVTTPGRIGSWVHISPYVTIIGGDHGRIWIGDFCFVSVGARLICAGEAMHGHGLIGPMIPQEFRDIIKGGELRLEDFSGIGANSTVMPGVTLAQGSILGAHSLLRHDTQPWTIYAGSPARAIGQRDPSRVQEMAKKLRQQRTHNDCK